MTSSIRQISWDEIVPRLSELHGRRVMINWGNRGEKRRAYCANIIHNTARQLFINLRDVTEVVRGIHYPDNTFGNSRYLIIDKTLEVWVDEKDNVTFSQLGTDITFFAPNPN